MQDQLRHIGSNTAETTRTIEGNAFSIERATLSTFRCHRFLRLETGPEPVVLTGRNGVGKTSVLEALSLLAPGRGLRRAKLDDLYLRSAEQCATAWAVAARLRRGDQIVEVGTGCEASPSKSDRRQMRVNGQPVRGQADLAEILSVVWLTPDMDRLFLDSAGSRRRFFDRVILGVDPTHARRLNAYERAMQERTHLLRDGAADRAWISVLEDGIAAHGVAIAASRVDIAEQLTAASRDGECFPEVKVAADGTVETWLRDQPALAAEDKLRNALEVNRRADGENGGAAVGPHRSDVHVYHAKSGRPARLCSTGEQKALLIALILASARLNAKIRGFAPLILLDEVAAHLDGWHRAALFEVVDTLGGQAWYAGTDREVFEPIRKTAQFFTIGEPHLEVLSAQAAYGHQGGSQCP